MTSPLVDRGSCKRLIGVGSALEGVLAAEQGADGIWLSSLCLSLHEVLPDEDLVSPHRIADVIRGIRRGTMAPVLLDAGNGGSVVRLLRNVETWRRCGMNGICIEDRAAPKRNSLVGGTDGLDDVEMMTEKVALLSEAAAELGFTVVARTDALILNFTIEEATRRGHAYVRAGAEVLFVHGSMEQGDAVIEFCCNWDLPVPLIVCPTAFPHLAGRLAMLKTVGAVILANQLTRGAFLFQRRLLASLTASNCDLERLESQLAPFREVVEFSARVTCTAAAREKAAGRMASAPVSLGGSEGGRGGRTRDSSANSLQES